MNPVLLAAAALLAAPLLGHPPAAAQLSSGMDCSQFTTPSILESCLDTQAIVNRHNRSFCVSRIDAARRMEAAGVRNAWLQVPTECLY